MTIRTRILGGYVLAALLLAVGAAGWIGTTRVGAHFDAAITGAIVAMAHKMGIPVVAEGVETEAQLDLLRRCGCDAVQGYRLRRPLAPEAVAQVLEGYAAQGSGRAGPVGPLPSCVACNLHEPRRACRRTPGNPSLECRSAQGGLAAADGAGAAPARTPDWTWNRHR